MHQGEEECRRRWRHGHGYGQWHADRRRVDKVTDGGRGSGDPDGALYDGRKDGTVGLVADGQRGRNGNVDTDWMKESSRSDQVTIPFRQKKFFVMRFHFCLQRPATVYGRRIGTETNFVLVSCACLIDCRQGCLGANGPPKLRNNFGHKYQKSSTI